MPKPHVILGLTEAMPRCEDTDPRVSLALGDLEDHSGELIWPPAADRFAMVKVGVRRRDALYVDGGAGDALRRIFDGIRGEPHRVLVYYIDLRDDGSARVSGGGEAGRFARELESFCESAAARGFSRVLIDTCHKRGRAAFDYAPQDRLADAIERCSRILPVMLAGSLRLEMLDAALGCGAAVVGFRSAVCQGGARGGELDPAKLEWLRQRTGGTIDR